MAHRTNRGRRWVISLSLILWVVASAAAQQNKVGQASAAKDEYPQGVGRELFLTVCGECHDAAMATGSGSRLKSGRAS